MKHAKVLQEWTTDAGLTAYMVVNKRGSINGYVAVDELHKTYKHEYYTYSVDFNDLEQWESKEQRRVQAAINEIDVHGGLTYGKTGLGELIVTDDYLFGFDTAHSGDGTNLTYAFKHLSEENDTIEEFVAETSYMTNFADDIWRTPAYVEQECENLAQQLMEI